MVVTTGGTDVAITRIPTGIPPLDLILGGGIPEGRVIEIFGPPSSAKSTLACLIVANKQKLSPVQECIWLIVEPFDPIWAKKFGVNTEKLLVVNLAYAEQVVEISEALLQADDCGLVVLDSLGAMVTQKENWKSDDDLAIVCRTLFHKVVDAQRTAEKEGRAPTFIFLNQVRWRNGKMDTPGGFTPKHAAAIRLRLSAKDVIDKTVHPSLPARKAIRVVIEKADVPVAAQECTFEIALLNQPGLKVGQVKDNWKIISPAFSQ